MPASTSRTAGPAIEDIELGYRLRMAGRKVILDKELQVTHLKRWTFWGLLKTDILDRGIPWTELILRDRYMPNDLNLELSQRVSVALAFLLLGVCVAAAIYWGAIFPDAADGAADLPAVAILAGVRLRTAFEAGADHAGISGRGDRLAGARAPYGRITPPLLLGCLLLFLRHRYGYESPTRARRFPGLILAIYILGATAYMVAHLPNHYLVFTFFVVAALIVVLNNQFYLFLAAKRGRFFALAAVPFHLLYHLYNGILVSWRGSHITTWRRLLHRTRHRRRKPSTSAAGQAALTSPAPAEGRQG